MASYAFWNNKGGVGKSFLGFIAATEYAHRHAEADVYVIDLCPQANLTETLLGEQSANAMASRMQGKTRATIAGYLESRLNSPFRMIDDVSQFITSPRDWNQNIPPNLKLICGDNLLEIIAEAIRQTSQLAIPVTAWAQVQQWVRDLVDSLNAFSEGRDTIFVIDCNPSFAMYTQLALVAADHVIVPFTADDSSRRAIENVVALLYGIGDEHISAYAQISFSKRAREEGIRVPTLHTFVSNRVTIYGDTASKAFEAVAKTIRNTMDAIFKGHRQIFASKQQPPSQSFFEVPDYHAAAIVAAVTGTPIHALKPGPRMLQGERIQLNKVPLDRYRSALNKFVDAL